PHPSRPPRFPYTTLFRSFGIIEMTRQRIRPSLRRSVYEDCTHCNSAGVVKTAESMAIDVMRLLALAAHREDIRRINVSVCSAVSDRKSTRLNSSHLVISY